MHRTDKYSQHSTIIWPVWLNGWVFVYEVSGSGFKSRCSHLNFKFRACFEQGVPWYSGNFRVWIHSETRTWHDNTIQSIELLLMVLVEKISSLLFSQQYSQVLLNEDKSLTCLKFETNEKMKNNYLYQCYYIHSEDSFLFIVCWIQ